MAMDESLLQARPAAPPEMERCTSCGARLSEKGYARFPCPMCGARLGRCWRCRKQSIDYRCACGFTGP